MKTLACWSALLLTPIIAMTQHITLEVPGQETAPHKFSLAAGVASGICPDVMRAMQRVDPTLAFRGYQTLTSIRRIERGLKEGHFHAACALLDSPARREFATIVNVPLYVVRHKVAARAEDTAAPTNFRELASASAGSFVITTAGSSYVALLKAHGIEVDDGSGDNQINLNKLLAGRGRFFYQSEMSLHSSIKAGALQNKIKVLPFEFQKDPIYFWVSRKQPPELAKRLGDALEQLSASGELKRIVERYSIP